MKRGRWGESPERPIGFVRRINAAARCRNAAARGIDVALLVRIAAFVVLELTMNKHS